ncbi:MULTISPECIES: helix-turn-helix domain-containing protein [Cupriavidus]|uniref:HTH-type transcriptional activator RhaR n=2 Tax=Cupriavidus TaxID=106589 RepID=A0ABM8XY71_9BURK|nr:MULTISPECIES: helix-turn-helix domain-containing protein [Cupriavidus]CAG9166351.1 HTH-type transcriptional activator RhaR [Cupriavidus pinatubonensis]CAG9185337.1 HTH-type transcriptional activator RhaR [Cupriavidus laharis]
MHGVTCCQLPVFRIANFEYGSEIKSTDFHMAPLQKLMSTLPYPHRHDFFHIVWVERGSGHHIIDSVKYDVRPHTMFFMSPGQIHDFELSDDTTGYTINFSAEFFALQLQNKNVLTEIPVFDLENQVQALYPDDEQATRIRATLEAIDQEYREEHYGAQDMIRSYLYILLVLASRLAAPGGNADASRRSLMLARRFKALLEQQFATVQEVADYASQLRVTERALNDATRRALGSTAAQLIRERVMLEAKRLLAHDELSVTAVAEGLGFEDPAYFSRIFRKHTGRAPLEFRQSLARLGA